MLIPIVFSTAPQTKRPAPVPQPRADRSLPSRKRPQRWLRFSLYWLVGGWADPSEKWWSSSVGMMTFPTEWKNRSHVPNHQPVGFFHPRYRDFEWRKWHHYTIYAVYWYRTNMKVSINGGTPIAGWFIIEKHHWHGWFDVPPIYGHP